MQKIAEWCKINFFSALNQYIHKTFKISNLVLKIRRQIKIDKFLASFLKMRFYDYCKFID